MANCLSGLGGSLQNYLPRFESEIRLNNVVVTFKSFNVKMDFIKNNSNIFLNNIPF